MASLLYFGANRIFLKDNKLRKQLKQKNISLNNINEVEKYVIDTISHDPLFLNYVMKKIKKNGSFSYELSYSPSITGTLFLINLDEKKIIASLINSNKKTLFNEFCISKLNYYTSSDYYSNVLLGEQINENTTYMDLFNLLRLDEEEFKKMIDANNFYGFTGTEFIDILSNEPLSENFNVLGFSKKEEASIRIALSEEEKEKIRKNKLSLFYYYEEEDMSQINNFSPNKVMIDEFVLTKELESDILCDLPEEFNLIQKVYFIYKRLCQKFSYDSEFFYLQNHKKSYESKINHHDINRLSTLKGGEEIVCFGISLLFAKFLDKFNIPFSLLDYKNNQVYDMNAGHIKVRFILDGYLIEADPAHGLMKSDLVYEKIYGRTHQFECINNLERIKDMFNKEKSSVDEYFDKNMTEFKDAREIYQSLYQKENIEMPFEDKIILFINMIQTQRLEFFDMIHLVSSVKKSLFEKENTNIHIEFIVHKTGEQTNLEILLVYNLNNIVNEDFSKNNYLIINSNRQVEYTDYNALKEQIDDGIYDFTDERRNFLKLKTEEKQDEFKSDKSRTR